LSAESANTERKTGGMLPLIGIALATLLAGGGVGAVVVGPMLAGGGGEAHAAAEEGGHGEEAEESGGHGEKSGGHGGGGAESEVYSIENLVVNPAGTQGSRFLIVSLTIVPDDGASRTELVARDAEIRDTLLQVLGSKTVQQLSDLTQREQMKEEMRAAAETVIQPGKIRRIFLPQFVLQ
jgi:flagellar protein FliL